MSLNNKKALSMIMIVGVIISIITLILLLMYVNSSFNNYQYSQSVLACNMLFSNIDGKPTYFGEKFDTISSKLIDEIAKQCSSKKVVIKKEEINIAADIIYECFTKTASGSDIFGANVVNQKICLYCGEIEAKEDISNFRSKLNTELSKKKYSSFYSKETEIENTNEFNMNNVPMNLQAGKSVTVFYYLYRSDIPKNGDFTTFARDQYLSSFSKFTGSTGSIGTILSYQFSGNVIKTYGGVLLTKEIENKNQEDFKQFTNTISKEDCSVIIPLKQFE